jgi:hypothetical protein
MGVQAHPTSLSLPVALQYQMKRTAMLYLRSGITGYAEDGGVPFNAQLANEYMVPVAAGAVFSIDPHLDLGAELAYPDVAGPLGLGFTAPTLGVKANLYL